MVEVSAALSPALVLPGAVLAAMPATVGGEGTLVADFSALLTGAALVVDAPTLPSGTAILADMATPAPVPSEADVVIAPPATHRQAGTSGKPTGKILPPGKLPLPRELASSTKAPPRDNGDAAPLEAETGDDLSVTQDRPASRPSAQQEDPAANFPAVVLTQSSADRFTGSNEPAVVVQATVAPPLVAHATQAPPSFEAHPTSAKPRPRDVAAVVAPQARQAKTPEATPATLIQAAAPAPILQPALSIEAASPEDKPHVRSAPAAAAPKTQQAQTAVSAPASASEAQTEAVAPVLQTSTAPALSQSRTPGPLKTATSASSAPGERVPTALPATARTMPEARRSERTIMASAQGASPVVSDIAQTTPAASGQPGLIRTTTAIPLAAATDGGTLLATMREAIQPTIAADGSIALKTTLLTAPLPSTALAAPALATSSLTKPSQPVSTLSVIGQAATPAAMAAPQIATPTISDDLPEQAPNATLATVVVSATALPAVPMAEPLPANAATPQTAPPLAPQPATVAQPVVVTGETLAHKPASPRPLAQVEVPAPFAQPDNLAAMAPADWRSTPAPVATPFAAPPATATPTQDIAALVDRITEARAAAAPHTIRAALMHEDFGSVSLNFRTEASHIHVTLGSADPGFAPAVQAAAAASLANKTNDGAPSEAPAPPSSAQPQDGASRNDGSQQQASRDRPHTSERQWSRSPSNRPSATRSDSPETPQHRNGIFA